MFRRVIVAVGFWVAGMMATVLLSMTILRASVGIIYSPKMVDTTLIVLVAGLVAGLGARFEWDIRAIDWGYGIVTTPDTRKWPPTGSP